jgi:cell division protein FtsI/penicillin-binding protein 2
MLAAGLYENLGLATNSSSSTGALTGKINFTSLDSSVLKEGLWAFPEKSFFDQRERTIDFHHAVKMTTLGGGIFRLTPLQTLEMYGKIFNYDRNYAISIDDTTKRHEGWLNVDTSWNGNFRDDFLSPQVNKGMEEVITSGTAEYLKDLRTKHHELDFYAKTGTIGASTGDNSKRLIIVISKKGESAKNKNYYIYFTIQNAYREDRSTINDNHKKWYIQPIINCTQQIIQSESFKIFMEL